MFTGRDFLNDHEANLLDCRFTLVEGHRLNQEMKFVDGRYEIPAAAMTMPNGVGLKGEVPANLIPLLFSLSDGTLREVTEAIITSPPDIVLANTGIGMRAWLSAADSWGLGEDLAGALRQAEVVARGPKAAGSLVTIGCDVRWRGLRRRLRGHLCRGLRGGRRLRRRCLGGRGLLRGLLRRRYLRHPSTRDLVLESLPRAERRHGCLLYLHRLAGARIAGCARGTDPFLEDTKPSDRYLVALGYRSLDLGQYRIERGRR